jgi:hypothetical protein
VNVINLPTVAMPLEQILNAAYTVAINELHTNAGDGSGWIEVG